MMTLKAAGFYRSEQAIRKKFTAAGILRLRPQTLGDVPRPAADPIMNIELPLDIEETEAGTQNIVEEPRIDDDLITIVDEGPPSEDELVANSNFDGTETDLTEELKSRFLEIFKKSIVNFNRTKLPKTILSVANQGVIRKLIELVKNPDDPTEVQLTKLNAALYAAVSVVTQSPIKPVAPAGFSKWLANKMAAIKSTRQLIGRAVVEDRIRREGSERTARQNMNAINLARYRRKYASGMDLNGFIVSQKEKLEGLKGEVAVRSKLEDQARLRRRNGLAPSLRKIECGRTPTIDVQTATEYWSTLARAPRSKPTKQWILRNWEREMQNCRLADQDWTTSLIREAIRNSDSWKAPGPDGLRCGFWKVGGVSDWLVEVVYKMVADGSPLPNWLCKGRTILLPKDGDDTLPENYRPITCLNTCYKIMTKAIASWIDLRSRDTPARPTEQRALRKGEWGTTSALVFDGAKLLDVRAQRGRKIHTAWIDYAKAYDSLPHSVIRTVLKSLRLPDGMYRTINTMMDSWKTQIEIGRSRGKVYRIQRGVLQGDSLSPLLFIIGISPLSAHLNRMAKCPTYTKLDGSLNFNHQLYVDDLKLYARTEESFKALFKATQVATEALGMRINLKKTAVTSVVTSFGESAEVPVLGVKDSYKYLGIYQNLVTDIGQTQKELTERMGAKIRRLMSSDLNVRQKVIGFNTTVIPMARYVYLNAINKGHLASDLAHAKKLDKWTRRLFVECKVRYSKGNTSRLYIPPEVGGLGIRRFETELKSDIVVREIYIRCHPTMKACLQLFEKMSSRNKRNPLSDGKVIRKGNSINMNFDLLQMNDKQAKSMSELAHTARLYLQQSQATLDLNRWRESMYHQRIMKDNNIDIKRSNLWVKGGNLSSESLRLGFAIQEGQVLVNTHPALAHKSSKCRKCGAERETVQHVLTTCPAWRTNANINRHDSAVRNIHYVACRKLGLDPPHYSQAIPSIMKNENGEVRWNMPVHTGTKLKHNRPDLTIHSRNRNEIIVVELAVSDPSNIAKQREIKRVKYAVNSSVAVDHTNAEELAPGPNLIQEMAQKHRCSVKLLVVVVGTAGEYGIKQASEVRRRLKLSKIETDNLLERIARSAVLGSCRVIKNHLVDSQISGERTGAQGVADNP